MELVYATGNPAGSACALAAVYALPPGAVTLSALGPQALASLAGGHKGLLRLNTGAGVLEEAATVFKFLCSRSPDRDVLLGADNKPQEQAAVNQWLELVATRGFEIRASNDLSELNAALLQHTFICGQTITAADLAVMAAIHSFIGKASAKELSSFGNVTRWFNHVQHLPGISQRLPDFPLVQLPTEKRQDNADPLAGCANGVTCHDAQKASKEAAASKPKQQGGAKAGERPVEDPMRLNLRVGVVRKAWRHPDADGLYCEEIDFGSLGTRQISSGLVKHMTQEELEGKKVVVLFNLKAKALRGFSSHGMVMCAATSDGAVCQVLTPPDDSPLGERVIVEGLEGDADEVLTQKKGKDTFAVVQPKLRTDAECIAMFENRRLVTPQGPVRCASVAGGSII